ncbi:MAG TPA: peptidylprolyl isomerase [Abditibacteriaceae bacterium]|nr:peptidylprolyl isomerase [Abditibacteriaceae bacterium]
MKRIFVVLPLACWLVGCSSKAEESKAPPEAAPAAVPAAVPADEPDPRYKVSEAAQPGMPPDLVEALAKVRVPPPLKSTEVPATARVRLTTSKGPITLELNGKEAPLHVKSFLYLAGRGFYNGVWFHRYANLMEGSPDGKTGWIIQGGDPLSKDEATRQYAGGGGPGYQVPREHNTLKHNSYVIAAARSQDPDSAGSQFYFTIDPVPFLDEGDGYTVFGKIIEGQANAKKLRQGDSIKSIAILK